MIMIAPSFLKWYDLVIGLELNKGGAYMNTKTTIGLLSPFLGGYYFSDITSSIQNTVQSYGAD